MRFAQRRVKGGHTEFMVLALQLYGERIALVAPIIVAT